MKKLHHSVFVAESPKTRILYSDSPLPAAEQFPPDLTPAAAIEYSMPTDESTAGDESQKKGEVEKQTPVILTSNKNLSSSEISRLTRLAEKWKTPTAFPVTGATPSTGVTNGFVEVANEFLYSGSTFDR